MSALLAIDTSTQACSAALLYNGECTQRLANEPRSHTRLLLPIVDELLASSGCTLQQLDAIAFTAGPGSFTGLRIGLGVVQGLAFAADLPVIGVSTLQALALRAQRQLSLAGDQFIVPAFDARMGEIYWGVYRTSCGNADGISAGKSSHKVPELVIADSLTAPAQVAKELNAPVLGVGEGWQYMDQFPLTASSVHTDLFPQAQDVLLLAELQWQLGKALPVEQAELIYLRDTVSWKKRERLRN